jgi:hypothetical protein
MTGASEDTFDWSNDAAVVVRQQDGIAVYANKFGQAVIRREASWSETEDAVVVIDRAHTHRHYSGPRAITVRVLAIVPVPLVRPVRGLDTQADRQLINPNDKAMTTAKTTRGLNGQTLRETSSFERLRRQPGRERSPEPPGKVELDLLDL